MKSPITVILLTFNSEKIIGQTLGAACKVSSDIHVVDSFSQDATLEITRRFGANITQRAFENYGDQRNWAIDNIPAPGGWQLHLDADEELTDQAVSEINALDLAATPIDGLMIRRRVAFMGKVLNWGGLSTTWHYRLFRSGKGRCENRLYDQHFLPLGTIGYLRGSILDHNTDTIAEWTARHNRWATLEAHEVTQHSDGHAQILLPRATGTPSQRKRYMKSKYYALPIFWRAFAYFIYRFFVCAAFLDGKPGIIFCVLQSFWFRFLVDAKIFEIRQRNAASLIGRASQAPRKAWLFNAR